MPPAPNSRAIAMPKAPGTKGRIRKLMGSVTGSASPSPVKYWAKLSAMLSTQAAFAVLFEGIPRRIVGLLFLGIGVHAQPRRGVGIDPGPGERPQQPGGHPQGSHVRRQSRGVPSRWHRYADNVRFHRGFCRGGLAKNKQDARTKGCRPSLGRQSPSRGRSASTAMPAATPSPTQRAVGQRGGIPRASSP